MNSLSDANGVRNASQTGYPVAGAGAGTLNAFLLPPSSVVPFEFRCLTGEDAEGMSLSAGSNGGQASAMHGIGNRTAGQPMGKASSAGLAGAGYDRGATEFSLRSAIDAAREEGIQQGRLEGRGTARTEMEAEMNLSVTRERSQLAAAIDQFRGVRDRYFTEVEQEVVKLALAIAARVLHREAQIDPLLLTGVVRVALEKMADRSGVVLRVAGADVEAWEAVFHSTEASERPSVAEDSRLERGECVLETKMGTVELGVRVQLEEIEKGFFDLLNHRPVE